MAFSPKFDFLPMSMLTKLTVVTKVILRFLIQSHRWAEDAQVSVKCTPFSCPFFTQTNFSCWVVLCRDGNDPGNSVQVERKFHFDGFDCYFCTVLNLYAPSHTCGATIKVVLFFCLRNGLATRDNVEWIFISQILKISVEVFRQISLLVKVVK